MTEVYISGNEIDSLARQNSLARPNQDICAVCTMRSAATRREFNMQP